MRSGRFLFSWALGLVCLVAAGCGSSGSGGDDGAVSDDVVIGDDAAPGDAAAQECETSADCDHGNDTQCLLNTCIPGSGQCEMTPAADGNPCGDGDPCTQDESCQGGECLGSEVCCGDGLDNDGDNQTDCDDLDCSSLPECDGTCPVVPAPDPVPETPLPGETPPGTFETVTAGGHTDDYVYNSAHDFKIGTRRQWGGTIVFFGMGNGSPGMNNTNTIDANDTGREVQVAFYDPDRHMQNCAWNASCQSTPTTCPFSITYPDATVSGVVAMHGWVLDNKGVASVELHVDGLFHTQATYGTSRPDVCAVWPSYADCDGVGYQLSLDAGALTPCPHLLEIVATDTDNNQRVIARRRIYASP